MGRSKKKSYSKRQRKEEFVKEDEDSASTEDTESELTEETPLVEKSARNQRKAERKHNKPSTTVWSDLNLMCSGCCGAMEVMESAEEEEDLFADDDNLISKFGHSIMHKAGFAPPVKIIRCTQVDDDTVITTPKVLIELAKQYDKERFWVSSEEPNDETDGTVATSRTTLSTMSSISKRLIPSISLPSGRSRASKSVAKSVRSKKPKKSKDSGERIKKPHRVSEGRFEI